MKRFIPVMLIFLIKGCMRGQVPTDFMTSELFLVFIGVVVLGAFIFRADSRPEDSENEKDEEQL